MRPKPHARWRHLCCLSCALGLVCAAGLLTFLASGCGGIRIGGVSEKEIANLDGVILYVDGSGYSWNLSISPSGQHVLINRPAVRYVSRNRYELDGVPGPEFDILLHWRWSRDGSTCVYLAKNVTTAPVGRFLVHGSTQFGPYDEISTPALSTDGKHWAAWVHRPGIDAPGQPVLLVDGAVRPVAVKVDWKSADLQWQVALDFDHTSHAFIVPTAPRTWSTIDGQPGESPDAAYSVLQPPALPAGVSVIKRATTNQFTFRQSPHSRTELLLNGRWLGEYDFVFGTRTNYSLVSPAQPQPSGLGKFAAAYPQSDGSIIFYAIRRNRLLRLQAKP